MASLTSQTPTTTHLTLHTIWSKLTTTEAARDLSLHERETAGTGGNITLVYGELGPTATMHVFAKIQYHSLRTRQKTSPSHSTFLDVGSGSGKVLIAAAVLGCQHPFASIIGIELLQSLHEVACTNVQEIDHNGRIECVHGDALSSDTLDKEQWSNIDVVFCNATMFNEKMLLQLSKLPLQAGTLCCTSSHKLNDSYWELMDEWVEEKDGNWGNATTLYMFVRRSKRETMIRRMAKQMSSA